MSAAEGVKTTDHVTIRQWADVRNAIPVRILGSDGEDTGRIQLDFPGYSGGEKLDPIGWEEWFQRFDELGLALILQEDTADGDTSNFNRFVNR